MSSFLSQCSLSRRQPRTFRLGGGHRLAFNDNLCTTEQTSMRKGKGKLRPPSKPQLR